MFQVFTDPSAWQALTAVNMDFDITSPSDGYTIAKRLTQVQLLQSDDVVTRLNSCATFNTALSPFAASSAVTGRALNQWIWSGSATSPVTVKSEVRTDGACGSSVPNAAAMTGNSGTVNNFLNNADSFLFNKFQPALRGNGPSGKPYHYVWKWHSFYHASETGSNQSGVWGAYYNDQWNNAVAPTGDQIKAFTNKLCCYYHTIFDYPSGGAGTWDWETANTGTPDDPHLTTSTGLAPNQLIVTFSDATTGLATSGTYFAYGHEHVDIFFFNGGTSHGTHSDVALDNDRLVYDEYYAEGQVAASCGGGGQVGQVAFNLSSYNSCPSGSAVVSVLDANGVSGMQVTVASPGTGDSELVTLTGSAPYFSGTINLSTTSGVGTNNGLLFVLPSETITATYTDASPAGSSAAVATTACAGGAVVYVSNAQFSDNGDNDGFADNNETVTMNLTVKNNLATPLTNAKVKIYAASPSIDCISDAQALYGTIPAGASATNPSNDRFTFHVSSSAACSDPLNPPIGKFIVVITGDGLDGSSTLQSFNLSLDLDPTAVGGAYNYSQSFGTDPAWATGSTPDDSPASTCPAFANNFHWCAACGNAGGGYGAWVGNAAFGTSGQNYIPLDSSTLYSPVFVANGAVGLQFSVAYRTESGYDGGTVQYQLNAGTWTDLAFTAPAQTAMTTPEFCSPFASPSPTTNLWTGLGSSWTPTNTTSVPASVGQTIQFRWRLGSDSSVVGTSYGGYGVDDVLITNLKQTVLCEPTTNSGLPACNLCQSSPDGTPCSDGNACTTGDSCSGGTCAPGAATVCNDGNACTNDSCVAPTGCVFTSNTNACDDGNPCTTGDTCADGTCLGTSVPPPAAVASLQVSKSGTDAVLTWSSVVGAVRYDVVRGALSAFPVGPGGGDETCLDSDDPGTSTLDSSIPVLGAGAWYLVRAEGCDSGSYGNQGLNGTPGAVRQTDTCAKQKYCRYKVDNRDALGGAQTTCPASFNCGTSCKQKKCDTIADCDASSIWATSGTLTGNNPTGCKVKFDVVECVETTNANCPGSLASFNVTACP